MERKYISANGVVERTRYAVGDNAKPRRGKRRGTSSFRKQEQNFNSALRRLSRILNCNYCNENGLLITLDYDEAGLDRIIGSLTEQDREMIRELRAPVGKIGTWRVRGREREGKANEKARQGCRALHGSDEGDCERDAEGADVYGADGDAEAVNRLREAADKQLTLWLRRLKRKYSGKIKAVLITSDVDHETGELVRVHHHVVLAAEGISWDLLRGEWKNGSVDIKQLRAQPDYTPIATYLMRQVRKQPDKKKYRVTQGMEQPKIEEREILCNTEMKAPAGANVLERSEYTAESIGQYIRYVPKKREYRRKRTQEWKEDTDEIP